jgi:hypothetical protein
MEKKSFNHKTGWNQALSWNQGGGGFQNVAHTTHRNKTNQVHCLQCSFAPSPPLCAKYAAESTYRLTGGFFSSLASLRTSFRWH